MSGVIGNGAAHRHHPGWLGWNRAPIRVYDGPYLGGVGRRLTVRGSELHVVHPRATGPDR